MNLIKVILQILIILIANQTSSFADEEKLTEVTKIIPGTYIAVSFSMPENSLKSYFAECQKYNAKLVIRGLPDDVDGNRFIQLKEKIEELEINLDINPVLFKELDIQKVPVIVVADKDKLIKKISGHIPLKTALEIMKKEPS